VAQLGSALDWGSRGREFKSRQPDGKDLVGGDLLGCMKAPKTLWAPFQEHCLQRVHALI
jgi:hypothetical protein